MKLFSIFIISAAFGADDLDISGTSWIQVDGPESRNVVKCPIKLSFEEMKYSYVNECHGAGRNKIVELGQYTVQTASIWFEERRVIVGAQSILGEEAFPVLIDSVQIDGSTMRFQVGSLVVFFEKQD